MTNLPLQFLLLVFVFDFAMADLMILRPKKCAATSRLPHQPHHPFILFPLHSHFQDEKLLREPSLSEALPVSLRKCGG